MKHVLVIGAGSIGERHVRCFQQTQRASVAVCDINSQLREHIADRYHLTHQFPSVEDALQTPTDAAVICTPAHLHVDIATKLVARGIPMLIEKPLSVTTSGVETLLNHVRQTKVVVEVAYVLRHHPVLQKLRNCLLSGTFGSPVELVYQGGQHFPMYRPAYRDIYYAKHQTGGGAIQDALTHVTNAAEWLVGPIRKLVADADHCVLPGVDVEDTVHVLTRHQQIDSDSGHGEVMGAFSLNQHQAPNEATLTVVCTKGTLRFESHKCCLMVSDAPGKDWQILEQLNIERDDLFIQQAHTFLDIVDHQHPPVCSLSDGIQSLNVNLAALQSVRTGKWVPL